MEAPIKPGEVRLTGKLYTMCSVCEFPHCIEVVSDAGPFTVVCQCGDRYEVFIELGLVI
jgi:hypothetical protein